MHTLTYLDSMLLRDGVFNQPIRLAWPTSWVPHIPFAFWIIDALKPTVFVELGTHSGNSYAAFVQAVQASALGTACYAVDTWKGDVQAGLYDEAVFNEWSAFHDRHFSSFSRLVRSTFDEARSMFLDGSIDLLHIDGLHTYDAIRHDFESWLPKLSERAVVLLHDINVHEGDFGAWRFWEEVTKRYPTFAFLHAHGLGIVAVGTELPPSIQWLVSELPAQRHERSIVQRFFAGLGGALEQQWQFRGLEKEHRELRGRVTELEALARQNGEENDALVARLRAHDKAGRKDAAEARTALELDTEGPGPAARASAGRRPLTAERLPTENERLREAAAEAERDLSASEAEILDLRVAAGGATQEHRAVSRALAAATRELLGIHESWMWRLTRPFRRISQLGLGPLFQARGLRPAAMVLRTALAPRRLMEVRRVVRSGLFDERFYLSRYDDVRQSGTPAVIHYVNAGAREGRSPHPLFDGEFYVANNLDVRKASVNPLLHYTQTGRQEQRDPHPLFSAAYYLARHPETPALEMNALQHYLSSPAGEDTSPHPLFDAAFYLAQNPDAARSGLHPLVCFLERGARDGRAPHPLFDAAFYLRQNPDVRSAGTNPLLHYLEHVPGEDRDPHPLFDSSFYLDRAPDLVKAGMNPLRHFVEHGWSEGRWPNPAFDPRWYLETNPDVMASGENPLAHFARVGWREGRDPSPEFSTAEYLALHPDIAASGTNPLHHHLSHGLREGRTVPRSHFTARRLSAPARVRLQVTGTAGKPAPASTPTIVCISHVVPWPPRAGNEYRLLRLLEWMVAEGYRVLLLLAPLPTDVVSPEQIDALVARVGNVALCGRDGRVTYALTSCPNVLAGLNGRHTRGSASALEPRRALPRELELLQIERTYCHDVLVEVALHAIDGLERVVLLSEYIWMTRLLPLIDGRVPTIVDTIDMYSTKSDKVLSFGVSDVALSGAEEAARLTRADLVLAIQDREQRLMQELLPAADIITTGVDFDTPATMITPPEPACVLIVGSGNEPNRLGLLDFLRFAWPSILEQVPDATLVIAGLVGQCVPDDTPRVEIVGTIDNLTPLYGRARVVVNPAPAGTGLKIKTLEALNHARPVVTWPNGFDGIPETMRRSIMFPGDWLEFAEYVVAYLKADSPGLDLETQSAVRTFVAPSTAYGALNDRLTRFFARGTTPA